MESANPQVLSGRAYQLLDAPAHFPGGLVGKGDGHDVPRGHAKLFDEVCDAVGKYASLARAGPRQYQHRSLHLAGGFTLLGVERVEEWWGRHQFNRLDDVVGV